MGLLTQAILLRLMIWPKYLIVLSRFKGSLIYLQRFNILLVQQTSMTIQEQLQMQIDSLVRSNTLMNIMLEVRQALLIRLVTLLLQQLLRMVGH